MHKSSYPASHISENCLLSLHPDGVQRSDVVSTLCGVTQEANHVVQTRALSVILVANRGDSPSTVAVTGKTPTGIGSSKAMKAVLAQKMRSDEMYVRTYIRVHVLCTVIPAYVQCTIMCLNGLQAPSSTSTQTGLPKVMMQSRTCIVCTVDEAQCGRLLYYTCKGYSDQLDCSIHVR